jgi:predicted DNA-binding transcriptional regulator YafY
MPINRNQQRRIKILNELFRSPRGYAKDELIDIVGERIKDYRRQTEKIADGKGISKRTIDADIAYMRNELGAPIEIDANGKYRYENPNYTTEGIDIDPDALLNLKMAAQLIQNIPGFELYDELQQLINKFEMRAEVTANNEQPIILFDTKPDFTGNKYLLNLYEAIANENVIRFNYQPFTADTPAEITLHPYLLKEYNNRWFLLGLTEQNRLDNIYFISVFGLDRIQGKIKPVAATQYYYHYSFNPTNYLNHVIGVSVPQDAKVETVELSFKNSRAAYIITNPLHHTQKKIKTTETHAIFEFQLILNRELEALLLSYGADVEVIKPALLRNNIATIIAENKKLYF